MGKIVKYCAVCEEGFAEKFSFCPNCAASLTAFEMNPVMSQQAKNIEPQFDEEPVNPTVNNFEATLPIPVVANATESVVEEIEPTRPAFLLDDDAELLDLNSDINITNDEPVTAVFEQVPVVPAATVGSFNQAYNIEQTASEEVTKDIYEPFVNPTTSTTDYQKEYKPIVNTTYKDDGIYHVALVEDKGSKMRQMLLLGAFVSVMLLTFAGVVVSLFTYNLDIGAINDESVIGLYSRRCG